jgi:hypothetical protein
MKIKNLNLKKIHTALREILYFRVRRSTSNTFRLVPIHGRNGHNIMIAELSATLVEYRAQW